MTAATATAYGTPAGYCGLHYRNPPLVVRDLIPGAEHAGVHALSVEQGDNVVRVANCFTGGALKARVESVALSESPSSRARTTVGMDASLRLRTA